MNVLYFVAACAVFTSAAYAQSRLKGDPFRVDVAVIFALAAGVASAMLGSRVPLPMCIVLASVATCATTDASSGYVYNVVTYPSLIAILISSIWAGNLVPSVLWSGATLFAGIIVYSAMRGRGIGLGDVKLFTVVAAGLGPAIGAVVMGSFILGACAVGIALIRRRLSLGQTVAFAPYIAIATLVIVPARELAR